MCVMSMFFLCRQLLVLNSISVSFNLIFGFACLSLVAYIIWKKKKLIKADPDETIEMTTPKKRLAPGPPGSTPYPGKGRRDPDITVKTESGTHRAVMHPPPSRNETAYFDAGNLSELEGNESVNLNVGGRIELHEGQGYEGGEGGEGGEEGAGEGGNVL